MISASSSSALRAARKLIAEPLVCLEHNRIRAVSFAQQVRRSHNTERPTSEKSRQHPPQPVPTTTKSRRRPQQNSKVKTGSSDGNLEGSKKLLEPYVLSKRLTNLASQGQLDEAVTMLVNSPADASSVTTWNTLLWHCMMGRRFKLGHKLYTHMRKCGIRPNVRTYNVLLSGLSRIEDWGEYSVQFKNAKALWQGFLQRIEYLKKIDPTGSEIKSDPAGFYISILAANNDYNAMFDVLNDLDEEGPFSPTEFTYTRMLQSLAYRTQLAPGDTENVAYRNASDAKLLWKQLTKRAVNNPELVSDRVVMYFLKALIKGRPADQLYAFDISHDYLGLSKPGEEAPPKRVEVAPMTLDAVLLLCFRTHKHRLCIHYVQQTIDEAIANGRKAIIDRGHMERVLRSYAAMTIAGSVGESDRAVETIEWMHKYHALGWNVKPEANTYGWGLMSCWRGGDWASAARITELMTGCHAEDFVDDPKTSPPRMDRRTQGQVFVPDARDMSCLLRAALASGEVANMRQCLRMATFFGGMRSSSGTKYMDVYLAHGQLSGAVPESTVLKRDEQFYSTKVVSTLADVLTRVLKGTSPAADTPEMKTWRKFRVRAKKAPVPQRSTESGAKTPESELQPLGGVGGLEAVERVVDYDLATRSQKPGRIMRR